MQSPPWPCSTPLLSQPHPSLHLALPLPSPRPFHGILPQLQNSDLDFNTHNTRGSGGGRGLRLACCRGRRQLGHGIPASTRCDPGVRLPPLTERCSARATWQPPRGNVTRKVGDRAELSPHWSRELAELSALPGMTWPRTACTIPST